MKVFLVAFCALAMASPALAQASEGGTTNGAATPSSAGDTPDSAGPGAARSDDSERLVCRRIEITGASRVQTRRVCRTAEEWRRERRSN
jgi:hypothetical protein